MLFFSKGRLASRIPLDNARFEARWPAGCGRLGDWAAFLQGARSWGSAGTGEADPAGRKTVKVQFSTPTPPPAFH